MLTTLRDDLATTRELVRWGKDAYRSDRLLRLSAKAILGRLGETAELMPDDLANELFGTDREAWIAQRILVDHIYHRLDYDEVWATLDTDVAAVADRLAARDQRSGTSRNDDA